MGRLRKLFRAIGLIMKRPYLLNRVIDENESWRALVEKDHGPGQGLREVRLADLGMRKEVSVKPFAFMEGGSLPTDLALLRLLAEGFGDCRYFEIGTWRGESVANVADVADSCTTLNLPADKMKALGLPDEYIAQHAMFSRKLLNVTHMECDSRDFDFSGLASEFDLVFIDGDHHYESVKRDTRNVFAHLLHERSVVVWHDYAWQPGHLRYETLAAILAGIPENCRNRLYAVRNTLCAIYYPGTVRSSAPSAIARADEAYEVTIRAPVT